MTLIELIGVVTIVAILAAIAVPNVIRQVDHAASTKEVSDLSTFGEALTRSIGRTWTIPDAAGMPAAIAAEVAVPLSRITTTSRGTQRAFLVDPSASLAASLPYTQTGSGGITPPGPSSTRIMIISSLSPANPLTAAEIGSMTTNKFNGIWETPDNTKPTIWTSWTGDGFDLRIQRINLDGLFHRLILINHDPGNSPGFSVNSGTSVTLLNIDGWHAYYLDGSIIGLANAAGLQTRHVLTSDVSFVFEKNAWRGQIGGGQSGSALPDEFADAAADFLSAQWNNHAKFGANQLPVVIAMYSFMLEYTMWASECPHFYRHTVNNVNNVPEYQMLDSMGAPANDKGFLDQYSKYLLQ